MHILTWEECSLKDYDPKKAVYVFDGKAVGTGMEGIRELKALPLGPKDRVRVVVPWDLGPSSPDLPPPYTDTDLITHWHGRGVSLEIEESSAEAQWERHVYPVKP
jgi:hypothetical protein